MCYDERGVQYKVPLYCLANPIELMSASADSSSVTNGGSYNINNNNNNNVTVNNNYYYNNTGTPTATAVAATEAAMVIAAGKAIVDSNRDKLVEAVPLQLKVRINPGMTTTGATAITYANAWSTISVVYYNDLINHVYTL